MFKSRGGPGSLRSRGFTLVEAMVGLALSSAIMLGVSQLFVANSQTYGLLVGQSNMQESARFALASIARSAQSAGFKGCFSTSEDLFRTFDTELPYEFDLGRPILGFDGSATTGTLSSLWTPDISSVLPRSTPSGNANTYTVGSLGTANGINTDVVFRRTDILRLAYASDARHQLSLNMPTSTEEVTLNDDDGVVITDPAVYGFATDHLAYISDCEKQSIFRITGFNGGKIQHVTGSVDDYANDIGRLAEFNSFETDAHVAPIVTETFFIAPSGSTNKTGQNPLSLWRKTGISAPVELVEGIEDLQILFGVDTDNDRIPNQYVPASVTLDFARVITLQVTVVANSIEDVGATQAPTHGCLPTGQQFCKAGGVDGMLRRTFSQTIALRNLR